MERSHSFEPAVKRSRSATGSVIRERPSAESSPESRERKLPSPASSSSSQLQPLSDSSSWDLFGEIYDLGDFSGIVGLDFGGPSPVQSLPETQISPFYFYPMTTADNYATSSRVFSNPIHSYSSHSDPYQRNTGFSLPSPISPPRVTSSSLHPNNNYPPHPLFSTPRYLPHHSNSPAALSSHSYIPPSSSAPAPVIAFQGPYEESSTAPYAFGLGRDQVFSFNFEELTQEAFAAESLRWAGK